MLKIFIKEDIENVININDVYFNKYTFKKLEYETTKNVVKEIDGVELTQDFKIISKFTDSILDLTKLSTGCKTVLNILYNQDKVFNISECGLNAISLIYEMSVGNVYVNTLVTPLLKDMDCNIEVVVKKASYNFASISDLRSWYSEVYMNEE